MNIRSPWRMGCLMVAGAFAAPLLAQPASAERPPRMASAVQHDMTGPRRARTDLRFLRGATRTNAVEVAAGRLAMERASDPAVRRFAQRMVDDHGRVGRELSQLARQQGLPTPQADAGPPSPELQPLRSLQGRDFDRQYVQRFGIQAHQEAITLFQRQATQGRDAAVMAFASRTLPALHEHLRMAQALPYGTGAPDAMQDARADVVEAVQVVQRMKAEPGMAALLAQAKGVLILPDYGRGALIIGAQGGEGVLVTRQREAWSNPVFYKMGGMSVGAQAGAASGPLALLLMTDRAVERFRSERKFSLSADAGLAVGDYSQRRQASAGKVQDVVVWSGTKGAYAGVSVGVTDVMLDRDANRAYYGREATAARILDGAVDNPRHNVLDRVLDL